MFIITLKTIRSIYVVKVTIGKCFICTDCIKNKYKMKVNTEKFQYIVFDKPPNVENSNVIIVNDVLIKSVCSQIVGDNC